MNDLVKITAQDGKQTVNARDLHAALEVGRDFATWIKGRIAEYGFVEGEDFWIATGFCSPDRGGTNGGKTGENSLFDRCRIRQLSNGCKTGENPNLIVPKTGDYQVGKKGYGGSRKGAGNPDFLPTDYLLSLGMAKELAVVENNEKGRQIRRQLIKIEEAWNDPELVLKRAAQALEDAGGRGAVGYREKTTGFEQAKIAIWKFLADEHLVEALGKRLADKVRMLTENLVAARSEIDDMLVERILHCDVIKNKLVRLCVRHKIDPDEIPTLRSWDQDEWPDNAEVKALMRWEPGLPWSGAAQERKQITA